MIVVVMRVASFFFCRLSAASDVFVVFLRMDEVKLPLKGRGGCLNYFCGSRQPEWMGWVCVCGGGNVLQSEARSKKI